MRGRKTHWPVRGEASVRPGGWCGPWYGESPCGHKGTQYWPRLASEVSCKRCLNYIGDPNEIDNVILRAEGEQLSGS